MDSITISNLDADLQQRLEARAARHGHSIEAEAREILRDALSGGSSSLTSATNMADAIRAIVEPIGGMDLEIPPRETVRLPPTFA